MIARRRHGRGFHYRDERGNAITDKATLARIRALVIPPAWTDVVIATDPRAKIQATGRDARGRKQYRYHAAFRRRAEARKYHRLVAFTRALPAVRRAVDRDLACDCLCKRKVAAAIVALLECAQLRVGNEEYAQANGSYGATTLRTRHVRVARDHIALHYRGKSGVERRVEIVDETLAAVIARCRALPGSHLFQYEDDATTAARPIRAHHVNAYLREVSGGDFTAKDFRTWAATIGAAQLLARVATADTPAQRKRAAAEAIATVAQRLGHTKAICRASYIHPKLVADFIAAVEPYAAFAKRLRHAEDPFALAQLRAAERAVARYLAA